MFDAMTQAAPAWWQPVFAWLAPFFWPVTLLGFGVLLAAGLRNQRANASLEQDLDQLLPAHEFQLGAEPAHASAVAVGQQSARMVESPWQTHATAHPKAVSPNHHWN
jgi:hypothetical protein